MNADRRSASGITWTQPLLWLWVSPASLLGGLIGLLGLCTGGQVRAISGTLEFSGGAVTWLLNRLPIQPMGMTLGHVILGVSPVALEIVRAHEQVHVRQYERWGPCFIPAYLLSSAWLWLRGRDCYRQNPFEVEAFAADEARQRQRRLGD